jgi:FAD/FMN-containing dehydrogenase
MPTISQDPPSPDCPHPPLPPHRRAVLRAAAASGLAAFGWQSVFLMPATAAEEEVPEDVDCYRQAYRNWAGEITADDVLTCAPRDLAETVAVVNWARGRGLRVRPAGMRHGWSPLTIPDGGGADYVLLDLTGHLTAVSVGQDAHGPTVTAQTGVTMEALLTTLEEHGYGLAAAPAPGRPSGRSAI